MWLDRVGENDECGYHPSGGGCGYNIFSGWCYINYKIVIQDKCYTRLFFGLVCISAHALGKCPPPFFIPSMFSS